LKNNPKRGYNSAKLSRKKKELSKESEKPKRIVEVSGKKALSLVFRAGKEAPDLVRRRDLFWIENEVERFDE
jgi:hypothetical protein